MSNIVIVGGGASGLIAAIYAKTSNNKVTILERNKEVGKKILVTGNGRCNYWNENITTKNYHSNNLEEVKNIITDKNKVEIMDFFNKIGIIPKVKDGYYYPRSNQATSIRNALKTEVNNLAIDIQYDTFVKDIKKQNNQFLLETSKGVIKADKVIIATGSKAMPKTGSDGNGYLLLKNLGHSLTELFPVLVQLEGKGNFFKLWEGVRSEAKLTLLEQGKKLATEIGEIQLTNYGISGICTFNLSHLVAKGLRKGKQEEVMIDFLPFLNINTAEDFITYFDQRNKLVANRSIEQLLEGILNYKLINTLLYLTSISKDTSWDKLTALEKTNLYNNLKNFKLEIIKTKSYDAAQSCGGGIPLLEINTKTMQSKLVDNLYIVGEILDVDGVCGGYNLAFAWLSGMLAGKDASKND